MDGVSRGTSDDPSSQRILKNIDTMAHLSELVCMAGFSRFAGERAAPLSQGAMKKYHYASLGGIVASEILKRLPVSRSKQKPLRMLSTALGLAAGFSMRWSLIFAGHAAAANPRLSRLVSQPDSRAVKPQRTAIGAARRENPAPRPGRARPAPVRGGT